MDSAPFTRLPPVPELVEPELSAKAGAVPLVQRYSTEADCETVVVAVERTVGHGLYQRYLRRTSKFHAHDESNQCKVGDEVVIVSCRPMSRTKRWRVSEVVKRAEVG